MNIELIIKDKVAEAIGSLYGQSVEPSQVQVQLTRAEFEGDHAEDGWCGAAGCCGGD